MRLPATSATPATTASTVAILDEAGHPLRPALLWMDSRASAQADRTAQFAADHPIPLETPTPDEWRRHVEAITGRTAPTKMGDGVAENDDVWFQSWASGMHPESQVDQAVMVTREAVFPHHGLDVWFD